MDTNMNERIASALRAELSRTRRSSRSLADAVGISTVSMSRYLNGARPIPADVLFSILEAVSADPVRFYGEALGLNDPCSDHVAMPEGMLKRDTVYIYDSSAGQVVERASIPQPEVHLGDDLSAVRICPQCGKGMMVTRGVV